MQNNVLRFAAFDAATSVADRRRGRPENNRTSRSAAAVAVRRERRGHRPGPIPIRYIRLTMCDCCLTELRR